MNGDAKAPLSRGAKRMRELAPIYEADRAKLESDILRDAGADSTLHKIAAEALSAAIVGARRRRAAGKFDTKELTLVAQLLRATGLRPPSGPPAAPSLDDLLDQVAAESDAAEETDS